MASALETAAERLRALAARLRARASVRLSARRHTASRRAREANVTGLDLPIGVGVSAIPAVHDHRPAPLLVPTRPVSRPTRAGTRDPYLMKSLNCPAELGERRSLAAQLRHRAIGGDELLLQRRTRRMRELLLERRRCACRAPTPGSVMRSLHVRDQAAPASVYSTISPLSAPNRSAARHPRRRTASCTPRVTRPGRS